MLTLFYQPTLNNYNNPSGIFMKKTQRSFKTASICALLSLGLSNHSFAEAPGGPNCGWGNMLFQGDKGLVPHTAAYLTNGLSSFNAFFGIVFGTNGCENDGVLSYTGVPMLGMNHILDELAVDMANGSGEALNALSVALKIEKEDRDYFDQVMHENFSTIFSHENIEAMQVMNNITTVISKDERLKNYLS
jgi:hypothetical protein